jgi:hypothetical protein
MPYIGMNSIEKQRWIFSGEHVKIAIDRLPFIGSFIEVEADTPSAIETGRLGCDGHAPRGRGKSWRGSGVHYGRSPPGSLYFAWKGGPCGRFSSGTEISGSPPLKGGSLRPESEHGQEGWGSGMRGVR